MSCSDDLAKAGEDPRRGCPPGPALRRRPRRLTTMTANDDTPETGQDSIDIDTDDWPPLDDEPDETVAMALEQQKQEVRAAVDAVNRALLNEHVPLTDEKVHALSVAGNALRGISGALSQRVPEEHRAGPESEIPDDQ